ncbi:MAG: CRISPR system precrRNA processing endoribonuclease RAMP protein Cas6 [Candidatus Sericytochromatia bacterium]
MISLSKYEIIIKPRNNLVLPKENKGNTLRGGFGITFKKMVCVKDFNFKCKECDFFKNCPYPIIFEPSPPEDAEALSKNSDIPRPFIIKPPLSKKTNYSNDDLIRFSLVLTNRIINLLPYFITTFIELGNQGIGVNRGQFDIISIKNNEKEIFSQGILQNYSENILIQKESKNISFIKLEFLTETTLKSAGKILEKPDFGTIIKRLRDRIASLDLFYGTKWEADFKKIGSEAELIKKVEDNTYWNNKSRFSKRNNVKHDMSGFLGEVSFEGNITPFMEILKIGELIHVGKGAVFGNGWYRIIEVK